MVMTRMVKLHSTKPVDLVTSRLLKFLSDMGPMSMQWIDQRKLQSLKLVDMVTRQLSLVFLIMVPRPIDLIRSCSCTTCTLVSSFQSGMTVLMNASIRGLNVVVTSLIDHGANLDLIARSNSKRRTAGTALLLAVIHNHLTIVKLLISAGADVNIPDHVSTMNYLPSLI